MSKFDEFATDELQVLVDWLESAGGRIDLGEHDSARAHVSWTASVKNARLRLARDYRHWAITLAFDDTDWYPVSWWEEALNGAASVPTKSNSSMDVRFLLEHFSALVSFPPVALVPRLVGMEHRYRLEMLR